MHIGFFGSPNNSQVIRVRGAAAPILFSFQLLVCYAHPIYRYIYIIRDPTHNRNNEFILREKKMAYLFIDCIFLLSYIFLRFCSVILYIYY